MALVDCYIIDRTDGSRLKFDHFNPISQDGPHAQYEETGARGSSEPESFYVKTGEDTYSFELKLVASIEEKDGGTHRRIHNQYLWLMSFQFPDYGQNFEGPVLPPRQAIITVGRFFRKRGLIKQPSATFNPPYDEEGLPYSIDYRFTFRAIHRRSLSYRDVREGAGNLAGRLA